MCAFQNPRKWRYTWETLAHIPTLRLFLFSSDVEPANRCKNLEVSLSFERSLLLVSWIEENEHRTDGSADFLLRVPVPRVLIDLGSPLGFRVAEDHIEVKLLLLLPVDHPLGANFDLVLNFFDESCDSKDLFSDRSLPFSADSVLGADMKYLSSRGGVHFYCKNCSVKLTKRPLRSFVEMPSANWREVADNWFGACCCSFGGISEKLVIKYANCYFCKEGTCLLDDAAVVVSKDDLVEDVFQESLDGSESHNHGHHLYDKDSNAVEAVKDSGSNCRHGLSSGNETDGGISGVHQLLDSKPINVEKCARNLESAATKRLSNVDTSFFNPPMSEFSGNEVPADGYLDEDHSFINENIPRHVCEGCSHDTSISSKDLDSTHNIKLIESQKSLLNGFLGNGFMIRTSNLSKDVNWIEYRCTHCSALLGAYPSDSNGLAPLDGGVRFFKCYTSTSLSVGELDDIFRNHTLEGMFLNQLMEMAKDELSFRTVVRDLKTRSPMLKIVLLNSKAWCSSGICLESDGTIEALSKIDLQPVVKVLFSDCREFTEDQLRLIEEWASKNQADEVYMLACQVKDLIESLKSRQNKFPLSCSFMQGLWLSSMERM